MSAWMIGLGLAGVFAGAVVGAVKEMVADWNGGQGSGHTARTMTKSIAIGAAFGVGMGWLVTGSSNDNDAMIKACQDNAPAGSTITITADKNVVTCSHKP